MVEPESRKAVMPESRFSDESILISYTIVVFLSRRLIDNKSVCGSANKSKTWARW